MITGTMKALIERHKKELKQYSNLDLAAIANTTYLNEFDREIQWVLIPVYLSTYADIA